MRFLRRNAIALTALVFAMGGTGLAASRYIITSTSQIKPSVVRELREEPRAATATVLAPAAKGVHTLRSRARTTGVVTAAYSPSLKRAVAHVGSIKRTRARMAEYRNFVVPMTNTSWLQYPEELVELIGKVTVTRPDWAECETEKDEIGPGHERQLIRLWVQLDGQVIAFYQQLGQYAGYGPPGEGERPPEAVTEPIIFNAIVGESSEWWVYPSGREEKHTIEVLAQDNCVTGGFPIDYLLVDALGVR